MKELEHIKAFTLAQENIETAFKNSTNPFHKNKYADLTALQNAVYPSFHANGFAILQIGGADEFGRYIETKFIHSSGGEFSGKIYLEWKPNDMQSLGSAITYARRYGLSSMSGVPVEDDDGNAASNNTKAKQDQQGKDVPKRSMPASLTPPNSKQEGSVRRGIKLKKFIETATSEQMESAGVEALQVITDLTNTQPDFADEIDRAWSERMKELETVK